MGSSEGLLYEELLRMLSEALRDQPRALELAKVLLEAYRVGGPRGVRKEIRRMVRRVIEGAVEAEEA